MTFSEKRIKITKFFLYILFIVVIFLPQTLLASSIFVTAPQQNKKPIIRIFDARTNQEIKNFLAYSKKNKSGFNIAVGDVNGDGKEEIITGPKKGWRPIIKIFSQKGKLLKKFLAYSNTDIGGIDVATGDLDNDGKNEIITGIQTGQSIIKIFNEKGQQITSSFFAFDKKFYGGVSVASGDIDNDENDEIIVSAGPGSNPHVKIFDKNGKQKSNSFFAFKSNFKQGVNVSAGDIDNDNYDEIVACKTSGSECKIYKYGFQKKAIKKIKIHNSKNKNINLNLGYVNSSTKQDLIAPSIKKSLAEIYNYNGEFSKSEINFSSSQKFSEIAFISNNSFNFIVYSDTQNVNKMPHTRAIEAIENEKYDFALNCGDFVVRNSASEWELFERLERNILFRKPQNELTNNLYPTYGDNEANSTYYQALFNVYPVNQPYYSFDYKNTHIISLNTNIDYATDSEQYKWLTSDLAQTTKYWKIVFFHHPAYGKILNRNNNNYQLDIQKYLVPILEQYNVNLVFNGHLHFYQRSYPIYQNQVNFENGIIYIINGLAGPSIPEINWYTAKSLKNTTYSKVLIRDNQAYLQTFDTYQKLKDKFRIINSNKSNE